MPLKHFYEKAQNELWTPQSLDFLQVEPLISSEHTTIESCLAIENKEDLAAPVIILPDLSTYLIFYLFKNGDSQIKVIGPRSHSLLLNRRNRKRTIILKLKPGALFNLTGIPVKELANRSAAVADIFKKRIAFQQIEDFIGAQNFDGLLAYLCINLTPKSKNKGYINDYIQLSLKLGLKVHDLSQHLGISSRYLQKLTTEQLGFQPKLTLRINRFLHSLELKSKQPDLAYVHLALDAGYWDQSHMIQEYQAFIDQTPFDIFG